MYQGRLVALGSPQGLKDGMKAGVMVEVQCRERLKALRLLRSVPSLGHASLFGSRLHLLVEDATQAEVEIRRKLEREGISVDRFEPIPFSLEDLFVIFIGMEEQRRRETNV
jgi:ABC-2 type transport system ATP-binding protein